jgi:hypothetical protein
MFWWQSGDCWTVKIEGPAEIGLEVQDVVVPQIWRFPFDPVG